MNSYASKVKALSECIENNALNSQLCLQQNTMGTLKNTFANMVENGEFLDTEIRCKGGDVLGIHRIVLCMHSSYFRELFAEVRKMMRFRLSLISNILSHYLLFAVTRV